MILAAWVAPHDGPHIVLGAKLWYAYIATMAKPRQESIKSRDGPRLLRVVELYVKEGRAAARGQ